ncbi:TadE/TadG family type IV pilus assembly protein [Sphingomonas sp. LT1P40]|uniref:TadE/TadG family type IV pilus assembly protein n=1 Tax=Alteristakelama amylovorans TaxID=3096166 RepID=UPI002FC6A172
MRLVSNRRGTAIVEFAILLPVILALLVGVLSFGLYFGAAHSVQQLAADAARRSVAGETTAERQTLVTDFVTANGPAYFLIRANRLSQVSATVEAGGRLRVRIAYDASWLPIFSFARIIPLPDSTITRDCVILEGSA